MLSVVLWRHCHEHKLYLTEACMPWNHPDLAAGAWFKLLLISKPCSSICY